MLKRGDFIANKQECTRLFLSGHSLLRRRITQGFYWTQIDKDLADQFIRDERWILGIKVLDAFKVIDHDADDSASTGIGFKNK